MVGIGKKIFPLAVNRYYMNLVPVPVYNKNNVSYFCSLLRYFSSLYEKNVQM